MCGGFVGDIIDGVTDAIGDVVDGVVDIVSDIGSGIDDFVHDVIPGGWAGVGALGLLAVGIYNPALLGMAEAGTLTTEALVAEGIDAAALATDVAAIAPEALAATEAAVTSGVAPEIIAMANATADPIAALAAAQGGSVIDTAYLASIGATPELIATAEAGNVALGYTAAGTSLAEAGTAVEGAGTATEAGAGTATEAGATTGATDTAGSTQVFEDGTTLTTNADGTLTSVNTDGVTQTTQIFDDGSTVTTAADGSVVSNTPATGGTGGVPVEDLSGTGTPGTNNPYGNGDIPLGTALKDYAGAVYDSLGPLGTAGLLGGGALATGLIGSPGIEASPTDMGASPYSWGQSQELVNPGLNPGYLGYAASMPDYKSTNPTDAQYYWGVHAPVNSQEDLANYGNLPDYAPATPWGAGKTAVGGQSSFNPTDFVNQYITNPAWAGVNNAAGPGYMPPTGAVSPVSAQPMSMAQQAIAARISGAPTAELTTGPAVPA